MINYTKIMTMAERCRIQLGEDNNSPIDIFALALAIENLTLVYYPMSDNMSGICIKADDGSSVIAINSKMTVGRQRFSLAHEFYHLFYDDSMMAICAKQVGVGKETEQMADAFAAYFLMPSAALSEKAENFNQKNCDGKLTIQDIIKIEQYFGVSHQAVLYHLRNCGLIDYDELNTFMNVSVITQAKLLGYSDGLYRPLPENKQYCTYGNYIYLANQLLEKDYISNGKYDELLLEAFRTDIVYGITEESDLID